MGRPCNAQRLPVPQWVSIHCSKVFWSSQVATRTGQFAAGQYAAAPAAETLSGPFLILSLQSCCL